MMILSLAYAYPRPSGSARGEVLLPGPPVGGEEQPSPGHLSVRRTAPWGSFPEAPPRGWEGPRASRPQILSGLGIRPMLTGSPARAPIQWALPNLPRSIQK